MKTTKRSNGKLSKKQIEKRWLAVIKKKYPHMSKEERLKVLFEIFPFLSFGFAGVDKKRRKYEITK